MHDVVKMLTIAERVVNQAIKLANDEGQERTGAHICVMHRKTHKLVLHALIGDGPDEKTHKWREFSAEQCVRLLGNPDHETSFESRSPNDNRWGGAILGTDYVFSLSGLKELDDEASMLVTSICVGDRDEAGTLTAFNEERSSNLRPLLEVVKTARAAEEAMARRIKEGLSLMDGFDARFASDLSM